MPDCRYVVRCSSVHIRGHHNDVVPADESSRAEPQQGLLGQALRQNGTLADDGPHARFVQNYAFSSPSAAASVVTGRPTSGPASWREVASGRTYKEWEAEQLAALGASDQ